MTAASDHASVTTRFAQAILEAAQRQGAQVPPPLAEAAVSRGARMPAAQQDALWVLFAQAAPDPLAGLRLGAGLQAGHLDIVGMLLLSCDRLADALEVLTEYAPIIGDNAQFEAARNAGEVTLRYLPAYRACREFRVEAALACVLNLARWMTNGRFRPREVWFAHEARAAVADYEAVLACPVRFARPASAVLMDEAALELELVHAGERLHAHLRLLADDMLAALPSGSVSARTRQWIRQHPRWGKDRVAEQLGMSGRHLNRKLAEEGISFKSLREALLHETAVQALRAGQPVTAVGESLGFSDDNAFARAFRRWTGQTPAQFARAAGA